MAQNPGETPVMFFNSVSAVLSIAWWALLLGSNVTRFKMDFWRGVHAIHRAKIDIKKDLE